MDGKPALAWMGCGCLAVKDGIGLISELPDKVWRRSFGAWQIIFNGTEDTQSPKDAPDLPPFAVYVKYNGWPAGIITPAGGVIAGGTAANEDTFIAAIEADLGRSIEAALSATD